MHYGRVVAREPAGEQPKDEGWQGLRLAIGSRGVLFFFTVWFKVPSALLFLRYLGCCTTVHA